MHRITNLWNRIRAITVVTCLYYSVLFYTCRRVFYCLGVRISWRFVPQFIMWSSVVWQHVSNMWGPVLQKNILPVSSGHALHLLLRNVGRSIYLPKPQYFISFRFTVLHFTCSDISNYFSYSFAASGYTREQMFVTAESDILYVF